MVLHPDGAAKAMNENLFPKLFQKLYFPTIDAKKGFVKPYKYANERVIVKALTNSFKYPKLNHHILSSEEGLKAILLILQESTLSGNKFLMQTVAALALKYF